MLAPAQNVFVDAAGEHHRLDFRVLEAQPLHGVVQLDVDGEVVGVELQLVVVAQSGVGGDRHGERCHRTVELEPPVPIGGRLRAKADLHQKSLYVSNDLVKTL